MILHDHEGQQREQHCSDETTDHASAGMLCGEHGSPGRMGRSAVRIGDDNITQFIFGPSQKYAATNEIVGEQLECAGAIDVLHLRPPCLTMKQSESGMPESGVFFIAGDRPDGSRGNPIWEPRTILAFGDFCLS
jgi:hypothetical protein